MKYKDKKVLGDLKTINSLKIQNLKHWRPKDFWELSLEKYRVSKKIRKIINKNGKGFMFRELAKQLGVTRHYIYQVMLMNIKPNKEFIEKLKEEIK
ncbi:hypothetical protein ES708_25718 [subsurface metagenome]